MLHPGKRELARNYCTAGSNGTWMRGFLSRWYVDVKPLFPWSKHPPTSGCCLLCKWIQFASTSRSNDSWLTGFYRLQLRSAVMETLHTGLDADASLLLLHVCVFIVFNILGTKRNSDCLSWYCARCNADKTRTFQTWLTGGRQSKANSSTGNWKGVNPFFFSRLPTFRKSTYTQ